MMCRDITPQWRVRPQRCVETSLHNGGFVTNDDGLKFHYDKHKRTCHAYSMGYSLG